jgi:hypothetical protein
VCDCGSTPADRTASAWWDSYCDSHSDPLHIGWDEFVEAFRNHHIPKA